MQTIVLMPKFDMDQEAATVIEWLKNVGDFVKEDETLLTVETDKIAIEVPSPASGILTEICAAVGERIPVTQRIAVISGERNAAPSGEMPEELSKQKQGQPKERKATPLAKRMAQDLGIDLGDVPTNQARITQADIEHFNAERQSEIASRVPVAATPAARRIAQEVGLDLAKLAGSGPAGRVQAKDADAAAQARPLIPERPLAGGREFESVPMSARRRTIAERMQISFQTAPHISLSIEVNVDQLEASRAKLNEIAEKNETVKISLTALLVKITAWALKRHPYINSSLVGDTIRLWKDANIGVAVAAEEGLIVPVIRFADQLSLDQIAVRFQDVAQRARTNKLTLEDIREGTFTITNLGMFNIPQFRAVINPPEAAILAVGSILRKPVVIGDSDRIEIRPMMVLTLSADHRIVDGVVAARFLNDLQLAIETPGALFYV